MLPAKYLVLPLGFACLAGILLGIGIATKSDFHIRAGLAAMVGSGASLALTIAYLAAK